jgi:hypothetical protein
LLLFSALGGTFKTSHITIEFGDPSKLTNKDFEFFVQIILPIEPTNFHVECRNVFNRLSLDEKGRNLVLGPGKHTEDIFFLENRRESGQIFIGDTC